MSIVHPKIKNPIDLIKYLGLEEYHYLGSSAIKIITSAWEFTVKIWKNVDLDTYTNHDINHSLFIIDYFLKLDALYQWSKLERLIFTIAALIHDIGMQYNKWATKGIEKLGFPSPNLSPDDIRDKHVELGYELIEKQLKGSYELLFPPTLADFKEDGIVQIVSRALIIAYSHSGEKYISIMQDPNNKNTYRSRYDKDAPGMETYRPILLAGTLKLCDEFEGNEKRILEHEKIDLWKMNDKSKAHWLSCLFVESTAISVEDDVATISIYWQVPQNCEPYPKELIKEFLSRMREVRIRREIEKVEKFYKTCDDFKIIKQFRVNKLSDNPSTFIFDLKKEYIKLMEKEVGSHSKGTNDSKSLMSAEEADANLNKIQFNGSNERLKANLINWYKKNREIGHYILLNNEHTNTYLNCRTLVSESNILTDITNELFNKYKDKKISNILAVGTSAIPLTVNLASRLKISSTFTFTKKKKRSNENEAEYIPIEVKPHLNKRDVVLIIDDIISSGNVAHEVMQSIYEHDELPKPRKVFHFSIFKLGQRKVDEQKKDNRITDYWSLLDIQDVIYSSSEITCPLCKENELATLEEEMY